MIRRRLPAPALGRLLACPPRLPPSAPLPLRRRGLVAAMAAAPLSRLPVLCAIARHDPASTAVVHAPSGRSFSYGQLLADVTRARDRLRDAAGGSAADLPGQRVALLADNSYDYVVALLAIMAVGSVAVPLSSAFPLSEMQYVLGHSRPLLLVSSPRFRNKAAEALASIPLTPAPAHLPQPKLLGRSFHEPVTLAQDDGAADAAGLMLYTSGTTSRPKGVLLPHSVLTAQAQSLIEAWHYTPSDRLLHLLPLHHIHGVVNALLAPLFAGASVEFIFPFNADAVWRRLAAPFLGPPAAGAFSSPPPPAPITFLTVVPTIYSRLLDSHAALPADLREPARDAVSPANMRLALSGSAALPTPVRVAWRELSRGGVLLERYGMTEVGMALSCGLDVADRVDASVGWPLPGVQARLVDIDTGLVIAPGHDLDPCGRERSGEIQIRGPTVFKEYWRDPDATAHEFVDASDGGPPWFKTGDLAFRRPVPGAGRGFQPWAAGPMYFIQGRISADIIKTGGEKVSALEVERELLSLPGVAEAAVVALPSARWGQKVAAVVVLSKHIVPRWSSLDMRRALKSRLAIYKIPHTFKVVDHIPRNAMGKINKKLVRAVFADDFSGDEA